MNRPTTQCTTTSPWRQPLNGCVGALALPTLLLGLWCVVSWLEVFPKILLPAPWQVAKAGLELLQSGALWRDIIASAQRTGFGFLLSATSALSLALLFRHKPKLHRFFHSSLEALRVTPPLALIPLLIVWLGIGEAPKLAIVILASFFPIFLSALTALTQVDRKLLEVGQILGFSAQETFTKIVLPASLPGLLTGLRLGFGYAWRALVGAELLAAASGLGHLITESADFGQTDKVFVGILTIALLGSLADRLLGKIIHATIERVSRGEALPQKETP